MITNKKKFYITTSLPYVNAAPHIGHVLDPLIADVLSRYYRKKENLVRFLVGTDENGGKVEQTAKLQNKTPKELVDTNLIYYQEMHKLLNISFDDFIRTSDKKRHFSGVKKIWETLINKGDIYFKKYQGLYCLGHEAFITEKDLIKGQCPDHQKEPIKLEEENWFFRLSKYSHLIEEAINSDKIKILPDGRKNEILNFIKSGLEDISVSRPSKNVSWGVGVPGDASQTIYVWLEALTAYISSLGFGQDAEAEETFNQWWPADVQVIGKDNLRFHAVIWPGLLLAADLALPKLIFTHGFITVNSKKISKTIGNIVSPIPLINQYGTDPIRYFFIKEFTSPRDGDFSEVRLKNRYNDDLANGLSNLVHRLLTLVWNNKNLFVLPLVKNKLTKEDQEIIEKYNFHVENFEFNEALNLIWKLIAFMDKKINETQLWGLIKTDQKKFILIAKELLQNLHLISELLEPFLPQTSEKILELIKLEYKPAPIFEKIGEVFF